MGASVDTFPQLFYGYSAIWILIVAYLFWISSRLAKVEKYED